MNVFELIYFPLYSLGIFFIISGRHMTNVAQHEPGSQLTCADQDYNFY